jgi:hypothetical protein
MAYPGPPPNKEKKEVKFGYNFSYMPPLKQILALILDFMAISNKIFWPYY